MFAKPAIDKDLLMRVPRAFARRHLLLPARSGDGTVMIVAAETSDPLATLNARCVLAASSTVIAPRELLARWIDEAYGSIRAVADDASPSEQATDSVERILATVDRDVLSTGGKSPLVQLADAILVEALAQRASDVHLQPLADRTLIRYRIDGVLHLMHELPASTATPLASRIKVMGGMDIAERRLPQDGRATISLGDRNVDLRVSTVPTSHGERVVLRLLDVSSAQQLWSLEGLGMTPTIRSRYLDLADRSHGMMLLTGPTGSGKTTTLYATLRWIAAGGCTGARGDLNILTIEDPIEYELSSAGLAISQSQVNAKKGITFASGLRHLLRQDPDVVMVGEIRDEETARLAVQASLTGHLVLSTLHTNDAPSAATRLLDLGIESYLVSAAIIGVLAQRLVRTVHTDCRGGGCERCVGTGMLGRVGIFELMRISPAIEELLSRGAPAAMVRRQAISEGMTTLRADGQRLVEAGLATLGEVTRVVSDDSSWAGSECVALDRARCWSDAATGGAA